MGITNFTTTLSRMLSLMSNGYKAIGSQVITLSTAGVYSLTVPEGANYALMVIEEAGGTTGTSKIVRFLETGANPTSSIGIPRGDLDAWDVISYQNLVNFKIIRVTAASHVLQVQYYQNL